MGEPLTSSSQAKRIEVIVYEDPDDDGNPDDAELLTQTDTTVANAGTDQFKTVPITPTTVSGSFFIAALFPNQPAETFPAPIDQDAPISNRSWYAAAGAGSFNINDLSDNSRTPILIEDGGFPGNWLLRADSEGQSQTGSISGMKWNDLNGDGVKELGEPGLEGWTIYLDENSNGTLDPTEPSEITDANGDYTFSDLPAGTYVVAEVQQPGWEQTFPDSIVPTEATEAA